MSRQSRAPLTREWDRLVVQLSKGKPQPKPHPSGLPLSDIRLRPNVFQHRDPNEHEGEAHVRKLVEAIGRSNTKTLEALTVWWDGRGWTGIDGHHRHAAYKSAGVGVNHLVPVEVFEGTLGGAMAQAAAGNSKNKRQMTTAEKTQAAWRMVVMDGSLSKAAVADAAGVSQSSVASMRKVHKKLNDEAENAAFEAPPNDHRNMRWADAKRLADGGESRDIDWESKDEKEAEGMALAIRKAIGNRGSQKLTVLARALELYDSRLEDTLMEHWGRNVSEDDDRGPA
jgi:ParB-like chromosome segregation protein Spo0J